MLRDCECTPDECLAYIDESGHPHQLDFGPYVIATVMAPKKCINTITRSLIEGTRRILEPISHVLQWFPKDAEIHTAEIVQGMKLWRKVKIKEKQRVLNDYSKLIVELPIKSIIIIVKRELGSIVYNWRGLRVHAYKILVERILMSPGRPPRNINFIIDSASPGIDEKIRADIEIGLRSGLVNTTQTEIVINFADSKTEPLLQVADFYAYLFREAEMHRYKIQRGKYVIDLETPLLNALERVRKCPETDIYEGCGIKRWVI